MSREIKFRVWDIYNKRFSVVRNSIREWSEFSIYDFMIGIFPPALGHFSFENFMASHEERIEYLKKEYIFMQYTGLVDKNGKEIYEGDILRDPFDPAGPLEPVKIVNALHCEPFKYWSSGEEFEIIGNIYENPELLEGVE